MSNQVQFKSFDFKNLPVRIIIDNTNEFWFCANDVCSILEYANPRQAVHKNCNPKGVSNRYTLTKGGNQEMVYINEPNLYRLIIKSRKPEAEPFEAWVFEEVLPQIRKTGQYSVQKQLALPEPPRTYTFEFTETELQDLAWAWFAFLRGAQTFQALYKPLNEIGSRYSGMVYGQAFEYRTTIRGSHKVIERITRQFDIDPMTNWRVLKHIRAFDPTFKNSVI
ncbi:Bro-N domain-containing protein [Pasteurellaceae bacterium TAE3-ERU1]|nr:Bro-N domain-containing protein [Pasteurellaceae bacterium TAE3-ERU1]